MSRLTSEKNKVRVSDQKLPNAEDLREAERELLQQTKEKQSVKNVLQQIKDMEAAEEAKKWRPPAKTGSGVHTPPSDSKKGKGLRSSSSGPDYVKLSSPKPTYANEPDAPKLPDRNPPKKQDIQLPEKKDKNKGIKKLFNFGKGKSDSKHQYEGLQDGDTEEIYEEICGGDTYEIPIEQAPTPTANRAPQTQPTKNKNPTSPPAPTDDIDSMTVEDVTKLLKKLGLEKHTSRFKKKRVSGLLLKRMDDEVLVKEFGFTKFDAIKLSTFVDEGHVPEL